MPRESGEGGTWVASRLERGDLELAKRNLDDFLLVGLTERFDESFIMLRRALGWRLPMYAARNVGRATNGSAPERPSELAIELIRERNSSTSSFTRMRAGCSKMPWRDRPPSFKRRGRGVQALNRIPNALGPRIPPRLRNPLRAVLPR